MMDMSPRTPQQSSSPFAAMAAFSWPDSLNSMDSLNSSSSPHTQEDARPPVTDSQPAKEGLSGLISPQKRQLRVKLPVSSRRSVSWDASPVNKPSLDRRSSQLPSPDYSCFRVTLVQGDVEGAGWGSPQQPRHGLWEAVQAQLRRAPAVLGWGDRHGPLSLALVVIGLILFSLLLGFFSNPIILSMKNTAGTNSIFGAPPGMEVDDLMAASRQDPDKPDEIWESGKDFSILHLDHIPEDAPQHADLGRYSKHLSGNRQPHLRLCVGGRGGMGVGEAC
ncbi:hypothetical protein WJX74_001536 [Apatococcus lobatus]|uniref:Uncharacterized protein n=1 Tax=Apatococcus lobatus TaxID=904363 RepID=A0AAW1RW99_9CHLO